MLYLEAPYYFINGVTVFRDHEDPLQYYYMPAQPRLRTMADANGVQVPRLQLIKYRSLVAGKGGFLTFDVHVGLSDKEVDDIAAEIRRMARLPGFPRVAPIQPLDGSVRLLILGTDSGATAAPPRPGAPVPPPQEKRFVVKAQHPAKPALFGDNGAAFSVELDEYGTAIMETALKGEIAPIVVVYSLDYAALRPAFSVRLHIDWSRVQSQLDESFGQSGAFSSVEISNAVDKLIENQTIKMEADNFVPDAGDAGKAVAERFESARMRVQEMITDSFFEPSLEPEKEKPDGWDKAAQLFDHVVASATTGGLSSVFGKMSYKKTTYERIDKRKLDVEISERSAVVRTIYPQGTVTGLFRELEAGLDPKRFILEVDADDPFFEKRRIRVVNRGEMVRDELVSVSATLTYGDAVRSAILTETGKEEVVEWLSELDNGAVSRPVEVEYTVAFKPDAGGERPLSVKSEPQILLGDVLEIQPAELYSRVTIPVIASPSYPWDKYPQVQVRLRYEDPANGIKTDDTIVLTKESKSQNWTFVALDKASRGFQVRFLHSAADNEDVDSGWLPVDGDLVDVRDPFGALRLAVDVVPVVARWEDLEQIFVDLEYEDGANDVHESAALTFTAEDKAPKQFVIDRVDRTHKLVSFRVTTIFKGGMVSEVPRSFTTAQRILIRPDMRGHRIVSVAAPADFVRAKLERVDVDLRYQDVANGITVADRAVFSTPNGTKWFEFDYVDPSLDAFEWRAKYVFENGMTQDSDWVEAEGDTLTVTVPN